MAGEIAIHYSTGQVVKAALISSDKTKVWNGSTFVAWSEITLALWRSSLITCVEQTLSTGETTGIYLGDFPASITQPGEYSVLFYTGVPNPYDNEIGGQSVPWNGTGPLLPIDNSKPVFRIF